LQYVSRNERRISAREHRRFSRPCCTASGEYMLIVA
jgi:hypothetical protein